MNPKMYVRVSEYDICMFIYPHIPLTYAYISSLYLSASKCVCMYERSLLDVILKCKHDLSGDELVSSIIYSI